MTESRYLVPTTVEMYSLGNGRARLSVLWTNGQRGKLDGAHTEIRGVQSTLLQAMSEQAMINVAQWPTMKIASGDEHDW